LAFKVDLFNFNADIAEKFFQISRFGVTENTLEILRLKMDALSNLDETILHGDVIEKIAQIVNSKSAAYQVSCDEVRQAIQDTILK
jgi:hypothetical protein